MQNRFSVLIPFFLHLSLSTLIHHDDHATSYQHIEMEHFHPVPTYIKHEDKEQFLKHPVSLGKTLTNIEINHDNIQNVKHPLLLEKDNSRVEISEKQRKQNTVLKHPVYPSYQGNDDNLLGLGAYSSDEISDGDDDRQYGVHENQEERENAEKQTYILRHQKNEEDYQQNLAYGSEQQESDGIVEGTPEYDAYQKLAQAALEGYQQEIDPYSYHQRDRRS